MGNLKFAIKLSNFFDDLKNIKNSVIFKKNKNIKNGSWLSIQEVISIFIFSDCLQRIYSSNKNQNFLFPENYKILIT